MEYLLLITGLVLVIAGSNCLVDGASAIARKLGVSEFLIGLTIVGIGTSTPEMVVSFISSARGNADLAIGNIVGSNIFNTFLILGVTALILPVKITKSEMRRDMPLNIFVTLLLILLGMKHSIFGFGTDSLGRMDGLIMVLLFGLYLWKSFKSGAQQDDDEGLMSEGSVKEYRYTIIPVAMVLLGLVALIAGGQLFLDNATVLARGWGLSDKVIGVTILAGGTSLPELATCIVAALKKKGQLALGNIIGSNVSNILLILGGSALISPLSMSGIDSTDLGFLLLASLFLPCAYFSFQKHKLDRTEGAAMLLLEAFYLYLLLAR